MKKVKYINANKAVLLFSILMCGCLSVIFGKELCWDLAHYHFYNPFALISGRRDIDFWPNSYIHQFINPTIDLLTYLLITYFTPWKTEFILGAIHGINIWLLFLIAQFFIQKPHKILLALSLAILGLLGPTTLPGIGSFQNDNLICIFILGFLFLQLKAFTAYKNDSAFPYFYLATSGFILGLGFGLKLTAGIYIAGAVIATLLSPFSIHYKIKAILTWGTTAVLGMLITNGYWMVLMWQEHHNPFFPFFNRIFQSPDFLSVDWRDTRFLPNTLSQTLFFPFYFSWDGRTADAPFRDFRFAVLYPLFIFSGLKWLWEKYKGEVDTARHSLIQYWLFAFYIFSYFIWQFYFSIARYLAPLEMLAPLVIYLLVKTIVRDTLIRFVCAFIIFYGLLVVMSPIPMIRAPWYDRSFFNVRLPKEIKNIPNATVLMTYTAYVMNRDPRPQTYLIPFFPSGWRFIGVPFWNQKYLSAQTTTRDIAAHLPGKGNKIFLLTSDINMPELYHSARKFGLVPDGKCEKIFSDRQAVTHLNVLLCPVVNK